MEIINFATLYPPREVMGSNPVVVLFFFSPSFFFFSYLTYFFLVCTYEICSVHHAE